MIDKNKLDQLVEKIKNEFSTENELSKYQNNTEDRILLEVSARHIHISREHLDILFGKGYELTPLKPLSQPGQFAAKETVRIIGPLNEIQPVRILGPVRKDTQVELSVSDCFYLGIEPVLRMSGDIENTPGCIIWGPKGFINLSKGVIVAKRHFHCTPETANRLNLQNNDEISIAIDSPRGCIVNHIVVRVSEKYSDAIHFDTDEGNAFGIKTGDYGKIIK